MDKTTLAALPVVALLACGGPSPQVDFPGTYTGSMITALSCQNGQSPSTSDAVTVNVADSAGSILINDGSPCADYTGATNGDSATINQKLCPEQSIQGGYMDVTITGGTASVSGSTLALTIDMSVTYKDSTGAVVGSCTGSVSGSLGK